MSAWTSTWAEVPGPDPIPIVGMLRLAVMYSAKRCGIHSSTSIEHPSSCKNLASLKIFAASWAFLPWTLYPPVALNCWGLSPIWPVMGIPISTSLLIWAACSNPPSIFSDPIFPSFISLTADSTHWDTLASKEPNGRSAITYFSCTPRSTDLHV
ncbi:hypothetical protein OGAPHI_004777 [Ogataea philodendri]|uniref:Uncharacterized protein n=1 Tax=Ogataea philodendri TaxID=1378263 RepID=A0A9P8P1Z3_9ASCO|nr:uncharacterized protein OGAPHI_004777 [Ogataea philodendri]KAH3664063.1 hypothetical protein OGAPHI_004777 [Ogataea philodendri]